jgi:hypothetical protein
MAIAGKAARLAQLVPTFRHKLPHFTTNDPNVKRFSHFCLLGRIERAVVLA